MQRTALIPGRPLLPAHVLQPVGPGQVAAASSLGLEVIALSARHGGRMLFRDIHFRLGPGQLAHVAGANGSGKTTLLRILCGLRAPASGEVRWRGPEPRDGGGSTLTRLLYNGHSNATKDDLTAEENLRLAAAIAGRRVSVAAARQALDRVGLAAAVDRCCRQLSQGQRLRVALALLALENAPPLWILDEPFIGLDTQGVSEIDRLIEHHLQAGGMAVVTTHQPVPVLARASVRLKLGSET
jgi:heme exporter protein A